MSTCVWQNSRLTIEAEEEFKKKWEHLTNKKPRKHRKMLLPVDREPKPKAPLVMDERSKKMLKIIQKHPAAKIKDLMQHSGWTKDGCNREIIKLINLEKIQRGGTRGNNHAPGAGYTYTAI